MPSSSAARVLFWLVAAESLQDQLALDGVHGGAHRETQAAQAGRGHGSGAAEIRRAGAGGAMVPRSEAMAERSSTLRSSRTLPGHG